jgi:hypothetical protein
MEGARVHVIGRLRAVTGLGGRAAFTWVIHTFGDGNTPSS